MADNIVLKTYKGGNVTPQDDAIIYALSKLLPSSWETACISHTTGTMRSRSFVS